MQSISEILVFDRKPSADVPASIVDILPIDVGVSEAAQIYNRHWRGGQYAGAHDGCFVAIRAGYRLTDGQSFFLFGYSPL